MQRWVVPVLAAQCLGMSIVTAGMVNGALAANAAPSTPADDPLSVVASFTILGDFVARIGAGKVTVNTLVGAGENPHTYAPAPSDAKALRGAHLIIINGLGFEGWMTRLVAASGTTAPVVSASDGVDVLSATELSAYGKGGAEHGHHGADPHAWLSAANALIYVRNITSALCRIDGRRCTEYRQRAAAYELELNHLDQYIKTQIARLAPSGRRVIAPHAAFGYFGQRYGITFFTAHGTNNAHGEASAAQVARLIRRVRQHGASAIFVESTSDARLMQQVASEVGIGLGGVLYADALSGVAGGARSYIELMRHNTDTLVAGIARGAR